MASLNESQEDVNKAPGEAWGCDGLWVQVDISACSLPQSALGQHGGFQGWAGTPCAQGRLSLTASCLPLVSHHGGGRANLSCSWFLSVFELLLCVLKEEL